MKTSERIIRRLNRGFGFGIPLNAPCFTHQYRGNKGLGAFSWVIANGAQDIGSSEPMTECLKWDRWIYSLSLNEIFEYIPNSHDEYIKDNDIIIEEK